MNSNYVSILINSLESAGFDAEYQSLCADYAQRLIDAELPVIFDIKHFALLLGIEPSKLINLLYADDDHLYKKARIPKKHGGFREINVPTETLKYSQKWIQKNMLDKMHFSDAASGYIKGSSILKNAQRHIGKKCILNLDIKDFFPSITYEDVFFIFHYYGYTYSLSNMFASLCTCNGVLPQGAPTSPAISNIRCLKLDKRIQQLCLKYHSDFSRYADDITISANYDLSDLKNIVIDVINDEGFEINSTKTRMTFAHQRQEVTGLIVNDGKVRVPSSYKRELRKQIYYCKKYGPTDHQKHIGDEHAFFKEHLYGKAYYIKMIEPELGELLLNELDVINWDN